MVQLWLSIYYNVINLQFKPVKLFQTKTQSLIGGERYLSAALSDASQFLLFPQSVNDNTLKVTPRVQFVPPVVKD